MDSPITLVTAIPGQRLAWEMPVHLTPFASVTASFGGTLLQPPTPTANGLLVTVECSDGWECTYTVPYGTLAQVAP